MFSRSLVIYMMHTYIPSSGSSPPTLRKKHLSKKCEKGQTLFFACRGHAKSNPKISECGHETKKQKNQGKRKPDKSKDGKTLKRFSSIAHFVTPALKLNALLASHALFLLRCIWMISHVHNVIP